MLTLTNFKAYTPEDPDKLQLHETLSIVFVRCDQKVDWYDAVAMFQPDTIKIVLDWNTGIIRYATKDASTIDAENYSVTEIEDAGQDLRDLQGKVFNYSNKKITERVYTDAELAVQAKAKIASLQSQASNKITPLLYAKDLDMITDEESAYLTNLQRYVVTLSRVTAQKGYPAVIDWPVLPTE